MKIHEGEMHGFPVAIYKHERFGHLCGYIAVPVDHPWCGKHYDDIHRADDALDVHGGLTWAGEALPDGSKPEDGGWVLGFDCSHVGDLVPHLGVSFDGDVYRDESYVKDELERLSARAQAAEAGAETGADESEGGAK